MDSSIASVLITYGPLGIFVVLLIFGILVPKWYVSKLEKQLELKDRALETERETTKNVTAQLTFANQLIGELRSLASDRHTSSYEGGTGGRSTDPRGSAV